jgi:hypothetical protein
MAAAAPALPICTSPRPVVPVSNAGSRSLLNDYCAARHSPQHPRTPQAIRVFLDHHNRDPNPFIRTTTADHILESVARSCKRICDSGHSKPEQDKRSGPQVAERAQRHDGGSRTEAGPQQPDALKLPQPLAVGHIALASALSLHPMDHACGRALKRTKERTVSVCGGIPPSVAYTSSCF